MTHKPSDITLTVELSNDGFSAPQEADILNWLTPLFEQTHSLIPKNKSITLSIKITGLDTMCALNNQYRQKNKPTNVLSFPCPLANLPNGFLGDIVLCAPKIEQEAVEQSKQTQHHWAHLVIHGTLHLLGFDHETSDDANIMEQIEVTTLKMLGIPNPYGALHE